MRIRQIVSHAIQLALSPPEASRSTSNPLIISPVFTVVVVGVFCCVFCLVLLSCLSFLLQGSNLVASWCTLCRGTPRFSREVMVY
jgi:hypothetical protein